MKYNNLRTDSANAVVRLLLVILVIALIAVGVIATYAWRQHQINSLNRKISTLQSQLQAKQGPQSNGTTPSQPMPATSYASDKGVQVVLFAPAKNSTVASPVAVIGEVPGSWSTEANFPILLEDSRGGIIAQGTAQVLGDWMTNQLVPFSAKLTFTGTPSGSGKLVLQKDNPSGLGQNADTVSIPIQF